MNPQVVQRRILYLTNKFEQPKTCIKVPLGGLSGYTGAKGKAFYTEGASESTLGLFIGPLKRTLFNATSYPYCNNDPIKAGIATSNAIKNIVCKLTQNTKDIFAFIVGGLCNETKEYANLIERSHCLFYDIISCIQERLPKEEGININPMIIWGKRDIWGKKNLETPDALYVNNGSFALVNPIFEKLFKNQKREYTQKELRNILNHIYEIVRIPEDVLIIPEKNYEPHKCPQEYMLRNS